MLSIDDKALVRDVRDTRRKLEKIARTATRSQRRAMAKAITPMLKRARINAPAMNKKFKTSLASKVWAKGDAVAGYVGQDFAKIKKQAAKAKARGVQKPGGGLSGKGLIVPIHFIEGAVSRHTVSGAPVLRWRLGGKGRGTRYAYRHEIQHPGYPARRWLEKTARQTLPQSQRIYAEHIAQAVDKEAARQALKHPRAT